MNFDVNTLSFVISLIDLLLVILFLLQYRINKNFSGPGWWMLGFSCTSISFMFLLLQPLMLNDILSIALTDTFFISGGIMIFIGILKFNGKPVRIDLLFILLGVLVILSFVAVFTSYMHHVLIALVTGTLGTLSAVTFWVLINQQNPSIRTSALFIGLVLGVYALILGIWAVNAILSLWQINLIDPDWSRTYGMLATLVIHLFLTAGLIFMINQRLNGEMVSAKANLLVSQKMYETFLNSTTDIAFLKDHELRYRMVNESQLLFFGKERSDLIGKTDFDLMPTEAAELCRASDLETIRSGECLIHIEQAGGRIYETRKFPVRLPDGKTGVGAFIRDITEARRAEEALNEERYLMRALMDSLPDRIYFKDMQSRFIRINKAHAESFGLKVGEEVGKSDFDFFTPEHAQEAFADEQMIIQSGQSLIKEERETWADRPETWVSTIKLPLRNQKGVIIGTCGISRDITANKQAEEEIRMKNRQLETINTEKDKLFSIIAHDLRSPFNALLGLTELMTDETEEITLAQMKGMAATLRKSACLLDTQLGNLLEWSRLQRNVVTANLIKHKLNQVVDAELELFSEVTQHKNICLTNLIPDDIHVSADLQMLHSILRNLLANGIKFTKRGGAVLLTCKNVKDGFVEISIKDSGIGMSQDIRDHLFSLDAPINRRGTDGEPSSGLGLVICKELIEKQGGKIWVESQEGVGSTFFFTLQQ